MPKLLVGAATIKIATGISNAEVVKIPCFGFDRAFMATIFGLILAWQQ